MKTVTGIARSRLLPGALEMLAAAGLLTTKFEEKQGKTWKKGTREKWAREYAPGFSFPLTEQLVSKAPKPRRGTHAADKKHPRSLARAVAQELIEALEPVVDRIEVVGSVRRKKALVGDVELLIIPKMDFSPEGVLKPLTDGVLEELLDRKIVALRLKEDGSLSSNGDKNKHMVHRATGIAVDLFFTTEENWWNSLVCRTGGAENNKALAMAAIKAGRNWNVYGCGVTCGDGTVIPATSEGHVFELCGMEYVAPEDRK